MNRLIIPDNIPADALELVQQMLNSLSEADNEGGISTYGYFVQKSGDFDFAAVCPDLVHQSIGSSIVIAHAFANAASDAPCDCGGCRAERAAKDKPADVDGLMNRLFGGHHG